MSARRGKAAPRAEASESASESTIYLDRDVAGSILVVQRGRVTATDAAGKLLGTFKTDREAMAEILAAAQKAREEPR